MLHLVFHLGDDRYCLPAKHVVEVVPKPTLRKLADSPPWLAGILVYRGTLVPVVDLCALSLGRRATDRLSTRIVVIRDPTAAEGTERLIGLLAERATEAIEWTAGEGAAKEMRFDLALDLGQVALESGETMRTLSLESLLQNRLDAAALARATETHADAAN